MLSALHRMRLILVLVTVMLLSTSCGSLTSVRGDDIYYGDTHKEKDKKKHSGKDRKGHDTKKEKGHSGKGGKDSGGTSVPFKIPRDLDDSTLALIREAISWIGTPYVYGGESKDGADCSGFVMMAYKNALGIKLPRTSADQGDFCENIDIKKLEVGDLVFFHGGNSKKVSHVGIYVGEGKFIHASSSKGVMISDLDMKYFVDHYHHSGKVTQLRKMRAK